MKELSKEDQERIAEAALRGAPFFGEMSFKDGAIYEHPIAKKEGFNEAIEEMRQLVWNHRHDPIASIAEIVEEINKRKR